MKISNREKESGSVLIISLLVLVLLLMLGMQGMATATMEEKMSGNSRQRNLAFQDAESALRAGEGWLDSLTSQPTTVSTCDEPPCDVFSLNSIDFNSNKTNSTWWETHAHRYNEEETSSRYIIEERETVTISASSGESLVVGQG
ncbi:pilus assembly PilX family protein, partial [Magnetococcales bacterium HHB-1]